MRILIIDLEYLVAMEAERILVAALDCASHLAMPRDFPAVLDDGHFDVVVIDASIVARDPQAEERLRASGAGVAFLTLGQENLRGIEGWPGVAVVLKPFDEHLLIGAVRNAAQM